MGPNPLPSSVQKGINLVRSRMKSCSGSLGRLWIRSGIREAFLWCDVLARRGVGTEWLSRAPQWIFFFLRIFCCPRPGPFVLKNKNGRLVRYCKSMDGYSLTTGTSSMPYMPRMESIYHARVFKF